MIIHTITLRIFFWIKAGEKPSDRQVPDIRSRVVFEQVGTPLTHECPMGRRGGANHGRGSKLGHNRTYEWIGGE